MDDYISRDAARENACERCGKQGHCNRPEFCPVIYSINTIPAADVVARDCYNRILKENDVMREQLAKIGKKPGDSMDDVRPVVRAEFVRCGDGKGVPYMCAHCGRTVPANLVEIWGVNFCPNCGADMREVNT